MAAKVALRRVCRGSSLVRRRYTPMTTTASKHSSTVGSWGKAFTSYERGTPVVRFNFIRLRPADGVGEGRCVAVKVASQAPSPKSGVHG